MSEQVKAECQLDIDHITQRRFATQASEPFESVSFAGPRNTLPSDIDIISSFVNQLMNFISKFRAAGGNNFEIELALCEALVNAVVHGNQKQAEKLVYVHCRCTRDGEVSITIQDEGRGLEHDAIPDAISQDNQLQTYGRGIYLMRTLMDDVDFEQDGSVVHMRKKANSDSDTARKPQ